MGRYGIMTGFFKTITILKCVFFKYSKYDSNTIKKNYLE